MIAPPEPALVERFRRDLENALGHRVDGLFALAVSGGPDSMAMLALADAAFPGQVAAATVDHGLRAESAEEARVVAHACAAIGVPHAILTPETRIRGASIQAQARAARYALLGDWAAASGAKALATAHHADDQAETFLMRAARGSGIAGLAAIREARDLAGDLLLVRPLLGWRRAELRAIAGAAGLPFVDDPANMDCRHDRTRFRRLLEENSWLDAEAIASSAAYLAEAERALTASADMLWGERAEVAGDRVCLDPRDLPRELLRRLVRTAVTLVRRRASIDAPPWSDAANVESLLDALERGAGATQAGVMVTPKRGAWHFQPAPPRRSH